MADPTHCAVFLIKQAEQQWRVQLEYDDGEVFLSNLTFKSEEEAAHAADIFILQYSSNNGSTVH